MTCIDFEKKMPISIMLVEDSKPFADAICNYLGRRNYLIHSHSDAYEAIEAIKHGLHYSLLIADLNLGSESNPILRFDGGDVMEISKSINLYTPILAISAYDDKPRMATRHLKKPIKIEMLSKIVEELVKF